MQRDEPADGAAEPNVTEPEVTEPDVAEPEDGRHAQPASSEGVAPGAQGDAPSPAASGEVPLPPASAVPQDLLSSPRSLDAMASDAARLSERAPSGDNGWQMVPQGPAEGPPSGDLHRLHPAASQVRRTGDALLGLLIIGLAFGGSMLFSLWARDAAMTPPAPPPGPPVLGLPGFPDQVRPFQLLDQAREMTVRQLFQGFVAEGMRSDGTLDLTEKGHRLRFSFQDRKGRGPQPLRDGGTLPLRTYCGRQSVIVGKDGMTVKEDMPNVPCPRSEPRSLPPPSTCRIEDVWQLAKRHRFQLSRPARLEYYRSKGGPAFRLVQKARNQKTLSLVVSARDCRSVLTGKKQRGSVP